VGSKAAYRFKYRAHHVREKQEKHDEQTLVIVSGRRQKERSVNDCPFSLTRKRFNARMTARQGGAFVCGKTSDTIFAARLMSLSVRCFMHMSSMSAFGFDDTSIMRIWISRIPIFASSCYRAICRNLPITSRGVRRGLKVLMTDRELERRVASDDGVSCAVFGCLVLPFAEEWPDGFCRVVQLCIVLFALIYLRRRTLVKCIHYIRTREVVTILESAVIMAKKDPEFYGDLFKTFEDEAWAFRERVCLGSCPEKELCSKGLQRDCRQCRHVKTEVEVHGPY